MAASYKTVHVINSLRGGGAEKLLLSLASVDPDFDILILQDRIDYDIPGDISKRIRSLDVSSPYDPRALIRLPKALTGYRVIHVHLFPALYWVALAAPKHCLLFFTEHSTSNRRRSRRIFRITDRFIYRRYHLIIAISMAVKRALMSDVGLGPDQIEVHSNGIDLRQYSKISPPGYTKNGIFYVSMVSSFSGAKDQASLVKALAVLPENVQLILAGIGDEQTKVENLAENLGVRHRIDFQGFVDDPRQIYLKCHIGVQSSHWEGFGLAAVEAMASGLPVIASDVEGLNSVMPGAEFLFPPGDAQSLAAKIQLFLDDEALRQASAKRCREWAQQYDIESHANGLRKIYDRYL
jgi:glycosyltransferase involved in cell wall biosynthesis